MQMTHTKLDALSKHASRKAQYKQGKHRVNKYQCTETRKMKMTKLFSGSQSHILTYVQCHNDTMDY